MRQAKLARVRRMTREELRRIFAEAEQKVCNPKVYAEITAKLTALGKVPPENKAEFSILVNRTVEREIVFEVLATLLVDKEP